MVRLLTAAAVSASLLGCGPRPLPDQPQVRWGEDVCAECRMILSEPRYAAACITADREVRLFDDIGDMVLYLRRQQDRPLKRWVHDYRGEDWLEADQAWLVRSAKLHTPMGHGLAACADETAARDLAAEVEGQVLQFQQLITGEVGLEPAAPETETPQGGS